MRVLGPPAQRLTGVGGWLAFYVFTSFASVLWLSLPQTGYKPSFLHWIDVTYVVAGVCAAVLLLRGSALALWFVAIDIALRLVAWGCIAYLDSRVHRMAHPMVDMVKMVEGISLNIVWFVYFRTSRRVHNTLGRNL